MSARRPPAGATCWVPSPEVRALVEDEGAVLMDLRTGKYHALNRIGTLIWRRLETGATRDSLERMLRAEYPEAAERIAADLDAWLRVLGERELVVESPAGADAEGEPPAAPAPLTEAAAAKERPLPAAVRQELEAALAAGARPRGPRGALRLARSWLALLAADLVLKGLGFARFHRLVGGLRTRSRERLDPRELVDLCAVVDAAARLYFKRAWCLQRSAVAVALLRRRGFPVELVIGVRRMPFLAHAWVEWGGVVVNDDRRVGSFYRAAERC